MSFLAVVVVRRTLRDGSVRDMPQHVSPEFFATSEEAERHAERFRREPSAENFTLVVEFGVGNLRPPLR